MGRYRTATSTNVVTQKLVKKCACVTDNVSWQRRRGGIPSPSGRSHRQLTRTFALGGRSEIIN